MIDKLDSLYRYLAVSGSFHRLCALSQILLFLAFFPTGLVKALGFPFAAANPGDPVADFFTAMHRTGVWWQFTGMGQAFAALLLLTKNWKHLGALMFLGILSNIVVLTFTMPFGLTRLVTGLMFCANLLLLMESYPRIRPLITLKTPHTALIDQMLGRLTRKEILALRLTTLLGFFAFDRTHYHYHWMNGITASILVHAFLMILGITILIMSYSQLREWKGIERRSGKDNLNSSK